MSSATSVVVRWAAARRRVRLHVQLAAFAADSVAHTLVLHSTPRRPSSDVVTSAARQLGLASTTVPTGDVRVQKKYASRVPPRGDAAPLLKAADLLGAAPLAAMLSQPLASALWRARRPDRVTPAEQRARGVRLLVDACASSDRIGPMVAALRAGEGAGILSAHTDEHNRAVRRAMAALRAAGRAPDVAQLYERSLRSSLRPSSHVLLQLCAAATAPPRVDGGSIGVPRSLSDANDESVAAARRAVAHVLEACAAGARLQTPAVGALLHACLMAGDAKTAVRVYSDHLEASAAALDGGDGGGGGSWRRRQMGSGEREAQGMLATTLACCAGAGDADAASRVVEIARAHGVTVGADANNALVNALSRGARREEATARARRVLAEEAEERSSGFQPHADVVAVNTALHALSRGPRPLEAADTFLALLRPPRRRNDDDSPPPPPPPIDIITLNTAVNACARARDARRAFGVLHAALRARPSLRPNLITFTSLVHACRRDRRAADGRRAYAAYKLSAEAGVRPDAEFLAELRAVAAAVESGEGRAAWRAALADAEARAGGAAASALRPSRRTMERTVAPYLPRERAVAEEEGEGEALVEEDDDDEPLPAYERPSAQTIELASMLARVFAAAPVATELLVRALPPPPKKRNS